MKHWSCAILLAVLAVSCGKKSEKPDEVVDTVETPAPPDLSDSKCLGKKVPPTNYMQETAFVPDGPNAMQEANDLATRKLRDRICQGFRCGEIAPKITIWSNEKDATQVCAMAVVKGSDVEEFKSGPRKKFDQDLQTRAQEIVKHSLGKKGEPRIAFDNITDIGVDGGPRAKWLVDRMTAALSKSGALIAGIPADWSGLGVPSGTDAVLRANITPMHGRESMLEVTWKIQLPRGMKAVDTIAFPELIGPSINPLTQLPELAGINPNISLRFDARPGGGLCNGQTTEMRLETSRDLHVRVVNLYGDGSRGIVVFASDGPVKAQKTLSLGEFQVMKDGDVPAERFLVVGAESKAGLGALANVPVNCRLPEALATQFSSNRGIPDGAKKFTSSRSYRIIEGPECSSYEPQTAPAGWFEQLPECF